MSREQLVAEMYHELMMLFEIDETEREILEKGYVYSSLASFNIRNGRSL